jgi:transcriptional regulator with XRE-family HTH domain
MYINTNVVRALMALRRIDESTLANIANVSPPLLSRWLNGEGDQSEDLVAFTAQLEILRVLGITEDTPRNDMVHYWYVHEPLFSLSSRNYWAVAQVTRAFGRAEVVYFAKDSDPMVSLGSKIHFGLQFPSFRAVLEVTSHPLRNVGFDPRHIGDAQWAPGHNGVLMDEADFVNLGPGLMTPRVFDAQLNVGKEMLAWERLNLLARDKNIGAEQLAALLLGAPSDAATPKLAAGTRRAAERPADDESTNEHVARPPHHAPAAAPTGRREQVREEHIDTAPSHEEEGAAETDLRASLRPRHPRPKGVSRRGPWVERQGPVESGRKD